VLTPLLDLALPLVGPIIKGRKSALEVAKWLQPSDSAYRCTCVVYEGLLLNLLRAFGVSKNFASCWQIIISTRVIEPQPGERFQLQLQRGLAT